jgi:hypothetical protein
MAIKINDELDLKILMQLIQLLAHIRISESDRFNKELVLRFDEKFINEELINLDKFPLLLKGGGITDEQASKILKNFIN